MPGEDQPRRFARSIPFEKNPPIGLPYETPHQPQGLLDFLGLRIHPLPVAMIVIGGFVLTIMLLPKWSCGCAKIAPAKVDMVNLETALDRFHVDNDRYPTAAEGLQALVTAPEDLKQTWRGPYIRMLPTDPWGNAYIYSEPGTHDNDFDLHSRGADKRDGTEDDVVNWSVR